MVAMNLVYALSAYPFGKLSDRMSHSKLLVLGLIVVIAADLVLAINDRWAVVLAGIALGGVHMGITQGLLATVFCVAARIGLAKYQSGIAAKEAVWLVSVFLHDQMTERFNGYGQLQIMRVRGDGMQVGAVKCRFICS